MAAQHPPLICEHHLSVHRRAVGRPGVGDRRCPAVPLQNGMLPAQRGMGHPDVSGATPADHLNTGPDREDLTLEVSVANHH